ncbi:MAG: branched-chain amino acid aminotransferase [Bacillus sp. (in: firmicutes)]
MLNKQLLQYVENYKDSEQVVQLGKEELEYISKHDLPIHDIKVVNAETRFQQLYIERCDKESDQFLGEEGYDFLKRPLHYLKENMKEFVYVEFQESAIIGVDGITLEVDDIFKTYNAMVGLKLQKKYEQEIKTFLNNTLQGNELKFALMWSQQDGLWDLNILLQGIEGFSEDMTIGQTLEQLYAYLFALGAAMEEGRSN